MAALLIVVGCNPIYIDIDYDKDADFTRYQTYSWLPIPEKPGNSAKAAEANNPLMRKRVVSFINENMQKKGFREVDEGGDVYLVYYTDAKELQEIQQTLYGRADVWADYAVGGSVTTTEVTEGHLIIDMIDGGTKKLVFRGMAENSRRDDASQEQLNETVEKAVEKIFDKYPPK